MSFLDNFKKDESNQSFHNRLILKFGDYIKQDDFLKRNKDEAFKKWFGFYLGQETYNGAPWEFANEFGDFMNYFIYEYKITESVGLLDYILEKKSSYFTQKELDHITQINNNRYLLFEIEEVQKHKAMKVRDLVSNEVFWITEKSAAVSEHIGWSMLGRITLGDEVLLLHVDMDLPLERRSEMDDFIRFAETSEFTAEYVHSVKKSGVEEMNMVSGLNLEKRVKKIFKMVQGKKFKIKKFKTEVLACSAENLKDFIGNLEIQIIEVYPEHKISDALIDLNEYICGLHGIECDLKPAKERVYYNEDKSLMDEDLFEEISDFLGVDHLSEDDKKKLFARNEFYEDNDPKSLKTENIILSLEKMVKGFNRTEFEVLVKKHVSSDVLSDVYFDDNRSLVEGWEEDLIWMSIKELWKRLYPNKLNVEMFQDEFDELIDDVDEDGIFTKGASSEILAIFKKYDEFLFKDKKKRKKVWKQIEKGYWDVEVILSEALDVMRRELDASKYQELVAYYAEIFTA